MCAPNGPPALVTYQPANKRGQSQNVKHTGRLRAKPKQAFPAGSEHKRMAARGQLFRGEEG